MASGTPQPPPTPVAPPTYWLTRFVILRLLGVLYAVAFLVAINQIVPLIGARGLLPVLYAGPLRFCRRWRAAAAMASRC